MVAIKARHYKSYAVFKIFFILKDPFSFTRVLLFLLCIFIQVNRYFHGGFLQFRGHFVGGQNKSKCRDGARLRLVCDCIVGMVAVI